MIKTILVCISGGETDETTLELAGRIAKQQKSHLEVLHVRPDSRGLAQYTGEGMDGSMIEEILEVSEGEGRARAKETRSKYEKFCRSSGITIAESLRIETNQQFVGLRRKDGRMKLLLFMVGYLIC